MKLTVKGKVFSLKDNYEVIDEYGSVRFRVVSESAFRFRVHIYDAFDQEIGYVEDTSKITRTSYDLYDESGLFTHMYRGKGFFTSKYHLDELGWTIKSANVWGYKYDYYCGTELVGHMETEGLKSVYHLDVTHDDDAPVCMLVTLAILHEIAKAAAAAAAA